VEKTTHLEALCSVLLTRYHSSIGENRGAYRVLVRKPEERIPIGRPMCRWENNIKMDLRDVGSGHELDRSDSR
jgi:hypothetical protein